MSIDEKDNGMTSSDRRVYELLRAEFDTAAPDVPPFDPDPELITHLDRRHALPHIRRHGRSAATPAHEPTERADEDPSVEGA